MRMWIGGTSELGRRPRAWLARGFLVATVAWMLMLVMVPFLLARGTGARAVTAASAGTYLVWSIVCHQRPDRSFRLWGVQMPVCARCAGLYLGAVVGALLAGGRRGARVTASMASPALRVLVLAAAVPTGVTWLAEAVGWLPFACGLRAVAAVPLGAAVTWVASLAIRGELA